MLSNGIEQTGNAQRNLIIFTQGHAMLLKHLYRHWPGYLADTITRLAAYN